MHGFGRREVRGIPASELRNLIIYQIGALQGLAKAGGYHLTHVRAHGALGNMSDAEPEMAEANKWGQVLHFSLVDKEFTSQSRIYFSRRQMNLLRAALKN